MQDPAPPRSAAPAKAAVIAAVIPDGRLLLEVPPPPEVPVNPVQVLVARHDAEELHLHARTAMPGWMGERLDVGWAINVLHPLAG